MADWISIRSPATRTILWVGAAIGLVGLAVLSAPLWSSLPIGFVWLGLMLVSVPVQLSALFGASRQATKRVSLVANTIEVRLRPHVLGGNAVFVAALGGFFGWGATARDSPVAEVSLLLASACLVFVLLCLRSLLRRPRLSLAPDGLAYTGWSIEASVPWSEVMGVEQDLASPHDRAIRIRLTPDAAARNIRRRWLAVPEKRGDSTSVRLRALLLDEPWLLLTFLEQLVRESDSERSARLDSRGLAFLDGTMR
ncbi:MAG: hypothetical protein WKF79_07035 [Nocardioides sp.]